MIRACLIWLALAAPLAADPLPALYDVTGVVAGDVLNVRAAASASSAIVGKIGRTAKGVEVVAVSGDGKWGLVSVGGEGRGYTALRYLRRAAGPDWFTLRSRFRCSGTEPFWSLAHDPTRSVAVFSTPEDQVPYAVTRRWPGSAWQPTAAIGLGEGRFATFRGASCSDGMSDRAYGIAATLFVTGPGGPATLHGCCTLQP